MLDQRVVATLASCDWIRNAQNIIQATALSDVDVLDAGLWVLQPSGLHQAFKTPSVPPSQFTFDYHAESVLERQTSASG
jgi:hypothetical protein